MKYFIINVFYLFVVVYLNQVCWYWYDTDDALRLNPCGTDATDESYVPESAVRVDYD